MPRTRSITGLLVACNVGCADVAAIEPWPTAGSGGAEPGGHGASTASGGGVGAAGGSGASSSSGIAAGGADVGGGGAGGTGACGNGVIEAGEECDTAAETLGCSADCLVKCDDDDIFYMPTLHCYRYEATPLPWGAAESSCNGFFQGTLAAFSSEQERVDLTFGVQQAQGDVDFWIGASDMFTEDKFTWTANEPWWDGGWASGHPDTNGMSANCVHVQWDTGWKFVEGYCTSAFPYLCERAPPGLLP
jgi:hypothetical protein